MALLDVILGRPADKAAPTSDVTAAILPFTVRDRLIETALLTATRSEAMGVPAVARARNLISGSIAGMPMLFYNELGEELDRLAWMRQPEIDTPRATTLAYTVDSLFFYGRAYWRVTDVYEEDGRPRRFEWIDPQIVTFDVNIETGRITRYYVNLNLVPTSGVGSLVVFSAVDEGVLVRGGRTIKTAVELESASQNYARDPAPSVTLKNTGMDLPANKVEELLQRWRDSRRTSSVGYLSAALDLETHGFSPRDLMLVEAREYQVQEIARLCGIPAWYLGAETGSSMTYSNLNSSRRDLIDFSLAPFIHAIEQRLSMDDVTRRGTHISFSYTDFLRSSPIERAQLANALIPLGVVTPEEWRRLEDLAPGGPIA